MRRLVIKKLPAPVNALQNPAQKKENKFKNLNILYILVVAYALFALNRIKSITPFHIDGFSVPNTVFLVLFANMVLLVRAFNKKVANLAQCVMLFLLSVIVALGLLDVGNKLQGIYAAVIMLLPLGFLVFARSQTKAQFRSLVFVFAIFSIVYAAIALVASFNYADIMGALGNEGNYSDHMRASLPIGSSITVCYYLNASLPLLFYFLKSAKKQITKTAWGLSILLNVAATFVQLSRAGALMCVLIMFFELIWLFRDKKNKRAALIMTLACVLGGCAFLITEVDLSRLFEGFFNGNTSDTARWNALELAMYLFEKTDYTGTGVGAYFFRLWKGKNTLVVDGVVGLIDPHNVYAMLLAEVGIMGTLLYLGILAVSFYAITKIKDKKARYAGILIMFAMMFNGLSGSHVVNELSYASIVFIYIATFVGLSKGKEDDVK